MQDVLCIEGGKQLSGKVRVAGAKNSALPLLIATLLTSEPCELTNVPNLEDIGVLLRLLRSLGAEYDYRGGNVAVCTPKIQGTEAAYGLVKSLRASFWVLGPLLARCGEAQVSLPGGDAIGTRPVDLHLAGLAKFGADIRMRHGVVCATVPGRLRPAEVQLQFPSVGATHQLLMTASLIPGKSVIRGAAREPEVAELAKLLNIMGAHVEGAGSDVIEIEGRKELGGGSLAVMGDRIEAATYLLSAAVTGGTVNVEGLEAASLRSTLDVLEAAGCHVLSSDSVITLRSDRRLTAASFDTAPFPGVATDVQPLLMAAMTKAEGESIINETVFENRFGHVAEYRRFGARIAIDGRVARVEGVDDLSAAPVQAGDIRAAAGLVLMGLMAEGVTRVADLHHLDRGYDGLVEKLRSLGGGVSRIPAFEGKEIVFGC